MCTDTRNNNKVWTIEEPRLEQNTTADYDKAVAETGFGLFNILLLLAAVPVGWTCIIDTTSTAFIINSTECIFELTMLRRGIAFATIFIGMVISGPIWDFFLQDSITDSFGKRNVMIVGLLFDAMCNVVWIHTNSYYVFILLKFISGILIAGPLSVVMAYLSEFHAQKHQKEFARWAGLLVGLSYILPAALAAVLFLQEPWSQLTIYNHFYPSWRVYLMICALPSILGLVLLCLMPKSPKHLMAQGKHKEALRLFRVMYCLNHFKASCNYPITELYSSRKDGETKIKFRDKVRERVSNLRTLFSGQHVNTISSILILQFGSMLGFNVMRLWVPPLFVMLNNFRVLLRSHYPKDEFITMCGMIFPRCRTIDRSSCNYTTPSVESAVYVNSTIIATSAVFFGFLFSFIFTTKIRRIIQITFLFLLATIGAFAANWVVKIPYMLAALAFVIVGCRIASNHILAHTSEVIPQPLRPTANSMINFIGNMGAAVGNIEFFSTIEIDCISAFFIIGFVTAVCAILVPIFLTRQTPVKIKKSRISSKY
ncbi:solute carrier family 22 member 5 [Copidosoma floridanum]|uniref:solute carrier family 22 member 5 n=1 Tax=Copidosoma floridanum TaxID=29053 RepID=UPI0006C9B3C0|nr:solute carrier family 22 member 5 [Copidosoma floridanum]